MLRRCRPLLGTFVEIEIENDDQAAIESAFAAVAHVHARMSFHEDTSDLARLRVASTGEAVEVDPATVEVLRLAESLHRATNGLFDVTIGRQLSRDGFLPQIAGVTRYDGGAGDIEIMDDRHVRWWRPVLIDLGGIAKGYAVDRAVEVLLAAGVAGGLVNAGGDLRVFGPGEATVHIRTGSGHIGAHLLVSDRAVASSGNLLHRHFRNGRVRTPHVAPGGRSVAVDETVTVVAQTCALADAMTKVAILDRKLAQSLLKQSGGSVIDDCWQDAA